MYNWPLHGHKELLPPTECISVFIQVGLSPQKQKPMATWRLRTDPPGHTGFLYFQVKLSMQVSEVQQFAGRGADGPAGVTNTHSGALVLFFFLLMASADQVSRVGFPWCNTEAGLCGKWSLLIQSVSCMSPFVLTFILACLSLFFYIGTK